MSNKNNKDIRLGSGFLYIMPYDGQIPSNDELERDENRLGFISGGATVSYTPTFKTISDDNKEVSRTFLTEEDVKLKTGVLNLNKNILSALLSTTKISEDDNNDIVEIGGISNYEEKLYVVHFVHVDKDLRITIVGCNEGGLEAAFSKDTEVVIDVEFTAQPYGDSGRLLRYQESKDNTVAKARSIETTTVDLGTLTVEELRAIAKEQGLTGYSTMTKAELIDLLEG